MYIMNQSMQAFVESFELAVEQVRGQIWEAQVEPYADGEWDLLEDAYDAMQLERATYHGMTEAEFLERYPDDDDDEWEAPEDSYADMIVDLGDRILYVHCDCDVCRDVCLCGCRDEPPQPRISPEATSRPFWQLKAIVRHPISLIWFVRRFVWRLTHR